MFFLFIKHPKYGERIKKHKKLRKRQNKYSYLFLISLFLGFYHCLLRCVLHEVVRVAARGLDRVCP